MFWCSEHSAQTIHAKTKNQAFRNNDDHINICQKSDTKKGKLGHILFTYLVNFSIIFNTAYFMMHEPKDFTFSCFMYWVFLPLLWPDTWAKATLEIILVQSKKNNTVHF